MLWRLDASKGTQLLFFSFMECLLPIIENRSYRVAQIQCFALSRPTGDMPIGLKIFCYLKLGYALMAGIGKDIWLLAVDQAIALHASVEDPSKHAANSTGLQLKTQIIAVQVKPRFAVADSRVASNNVVLPLTRTRTTESGLSACV